MGIYISKNSTLEENHKKELEKRKTEAVLAEKTRKLNLVKIEEELKTQDEAKMVEILMSKAELEFGMRKYIIDKGVALANCIQRSGENPEDIANTFLSTCELADKPKVQSGCRQIDNDVSFSTDITVFRKNL